MVAFLSKSLLTQWLNKDLERFRAELAAEAQKKGAELGAELQRITVEHQVSFKRVYEKRTFVIATVFALLDDLHSVVSTWCELKDWNRREHPAFVTQLYKAASDSKSKLARFYYPRAIWLDPPLCDKLNGILADVDVLLSILGDEEAQPEPARPLAEGLLNRITVARGELDVSFRSILGNTKPASVPVASLPT